MTASMSKRVNKIPIRITAVSNEPLYPKRVVPRTLIDILEVLGESNQICLLQPGLQQWERGEKLFRTYTFPKKPAYLKRLLDIFEEKSFSLAKALGSLLNLTIYPKLFALSQISDIFMCYEITYCIPTLIVAKLARKPVILIGDILSISYLRKVRAVSTFLSYLLLTWEKTCELLVNCIAVWGKDDKKFLLSIGLPKQKITTIPLSLDLQKIDRLSQQKNNEPAYTKLKALKDQGYKILMFHGTLEYGPNRACAEYIENELAPKMFTKNRKIIFAIVGAGYTSNKPENRIVFTGYVQNIYSILKLADVGIVPLKSGTGVKNKLLEYFALSKSVVTTPIGAENLGTKNMTHLIVTGLDNFDEKVSLLLENPELSDKIGANAQEYVWKNHSLTNYLQYSQLQNTCNAES